MFKAIIAATVLSASLVSISDAGASGGWSRHGKKEGVAVYTSSKSGSKVPMVKAVTIVNAPTSEVWNYITGPRIDMSGIKDRRNLGTCGDSCDYIYVRLGNMFITDRHYVVKMKNSRETVDGHTYFKREWSQTSRRMPSGSSAMKVRNIEGSWLLEPVHNGSRTRLTYINHMDLGGSVPSGMFSSGFVKKSYEILSTIKKEI